MEHRAGPSPPALDEVHQFAIVLVDGFSLISLAAVIDPLRAANRLLGRRAYGWRLATVKGGPAEASSGITVNADGSLADLPSARLVIVCAGLDIAPKGEREIAAFLRRRASIGEPLGAVSTGSWLLGVAGLLDGYRCTIHWERRAAFAQIAPRAHVTDAPYEVDRDRYTSSGGTASIDMMAHMIGIDFGADLSRHVANQFQHERIRSSADRQRPASEPDLAGKPDSVARIIKLMAANIERPLSAQELACAVNLSVRQVERLFERHVDQAPKTYYINMRLQRARELLRQTNASVLDVALSTGFASQSHFAQSYRALFGKNPSDERRTL